MSNAWLTVASRARCAAPSAQRQPILHLFRGFQRYHSSQNLTRAQKPAPAIQRSQSVFDHTLFYQHARYSSKASKRRKKSKADDDSKLQPATTVGSHTEGVVESVPTGDEGITWRDYDPEGGMPLPNGELSQAEINAIFGGEGVDEDTGNYILSVMQWRRVSGALIDVGLDFPKARQIPRWQALQGLEYLRSLDSSFDEQVAGERWAAEETERLREELRERAVSLKLYKPDPAEEEEESDQGTDYGRQRSGESTLQMMQRHNEAKWEKEQAEKEARERQEQNAEINSARGPLELSGGVQPSVALTKYESLGDVEITRAQTKGWLKPVERKEWVKYYEDQATIIKDNTVPQLSLLQRLGPATLLAMLGLAALLVLSDQYTPPPKSARIFPETAPAVTTIGAITGVILTTFIMSRLPIFWRLSSKYFCIVPAYPFAVSLVGAAWRHDTVSHLAANLTALWLFGLSLHEDVGRGTFLAIFLGGSIFGGWVSLTHSVLLQRWMTYSFGSSGGVLGVVAASCALRPNGSVTIWGVDVPYVTWMLVGLYSLGELYGMARFHKKTNVDHAGHVGGLLTGVLAAYRLKTQQPANSETPMKHTPAVESLQS